MVGRPRQGEIRYIVTVAKAEERAIAEARAELERALGRWQELAGELPAAETDSGIPVAPLYTALDVPAGAGRRPPRRASVHPRHPRLDVSEAALHDAPLRRLGGPEDTNERFRYLLEQGQTGLSVALDLPTQMGLDSDHELAEGEVGKVGVAIDSLADMERLFEAIPLDRVSTSFTINATAPILLAMYQVVGERQGVAPTSCAGRCRTTSSRSSSRARRTSTRPALRCAWSPT